MTILGIILAVFGLGGLALKFTGVYELPGIVGDAKVLAGVAVVGVVLYILTRRPAD